MILNQRPLTDRFVCGLIGHDHNKAMTFYPGCDTEENYLKNCELLSSKWYYYNNPIEYKYNSLGFRCNEPDSLENDYLLFAGCSFTEGVALHLENTYPYIVAEKLKKTYFNLSVGGSGPDIVKHNLVMFLSYMLKKNKLPKYVIIQWPDFNRLSMFGNDFHHHNLNPWCELQTLYKKMIEDNLPLHCNIFNRYTTLQFMKNLGIENVIEVSFEGNEYFSTNTLQLNVNLWLDGEPLEKARDLSHPGIINHKIFSEKILDAISNI